MTFIKVYSSAKYNKFFNVLILTVSNIFYAFINPLKIMLPRDLLYDIADIYE